MDIFSNKYKLVESKSTILLSEYINHFNDNQYFLQFCAQCPTYGTRWCCPPFDFSPIEKIENFKYAHIFGNQLFFTDEQIQKSKTEKNGERICRESIENVIIELHPKLLEMRDKNAPAIAFSVGCYLCKEKGCSRLNGEKCRYPQKMLHSLESFGFNIAKSCKELLNIDLLWSSDGILPRYITVVTAIFSNDKVLK